MIRVRGQATTALLAVGETPVTHEFTLERNGGRPMKIVQVVANAPYIKAEATRYKRRPFGE